MKIVYKKSIFAKMNEAITEAIKYDKEIECFYLDEEEFKEFKRVVDRSRTWVYDAPPDLDEYRYHNFPVKKLI